MYPSNLVPIKTIYWEVTPLFTISRLFGLAPYNSFFKPSLLFIIYSILLLLITLGDCAFMAIFMEKVNDTYTFSKFSLILERAQLLIIVSSVVVSIMKPLLNSKSFQCIMETFHKVDTNLKEVAVFIEHNRRYVYIIVIIKLILVFNIFICDITIFKIYRSYGSLFMEYICIMPLIVNNLMEAQFMILLNSVQKRIKILTQNIVLIDKNKYSTQKMKRLKVFIKVYSDLIDICENVNTLFSSQILFTLSSIFIITTANLYHVIEKIMKYVTDQRYSDYNLLFMLSYRITVRSSEVWSLITSCVNTQNKANEFSRTLYQIMIEDKSGDIINDGQLRLHISMKREVIFTAYGFFALDFTLVNSMIAAATAYLVILIQFSQITTPGTDDNHVNNTTNQNFYY